MRFSRVGNHLLALDGDRLTIDGIPVPLPGRGFVDEDDLMSWVRTAFLGTGDALTIWEIMGPEKPKII